MFDKIKAGWVWYRQTATIVGIPLVFLLVILGVQKFAATGACYTAGYGCEYAIGAEGAMMSYMGDILTANPNVDIVAKPKGK